MMKKGSSVIIPLDFSTYIVSSLGRRFDTVRSFELESAGAPPSLAGPKGREPAPEPVLKPFSSGIEFTVAP